MELTDVIKSRYSCRKFDGRPVADDALEAILEAGRLAPTAKNFQEQHIYVVQSEEGLAKLDTVTQCRYGAPTCLVVAYDTGNVFSYPGHKRDSGVEDATIVTTHMILAATDQGVDSCWVNYFDPENLASTLELPANEEAVAILDLGYAEAGVTPAAMHADRKPLSQTVSYL